MVRFGPPNASAGVLSDANRRWRAWHPSIALPPPAVWSRCGRSSYTDRQKPRPPALDASCTLNTHQAMDLGAGIELAVA